MEALLVIDVQQALITGAYRESETLSAIQNAIQRIRDRGGIIVYVQHCHSSFDPMKKGNPGWELHESLDARGDDVFIEKEASDSFYETDLDSTLRENKVDHVFVTGLQTEFCVDATCRAALSRGYRVTLVSDGHTTGDSVLPAKQSIEHHNFVLSNLAHPKSGIELEESSVI